MGNNFFTSSSSPFYRPKRRLDTSRLDPNSEWPTLNPEDDLVERLNVRLSLKEKVRLRKLAVSYSHGSVSALIRHLILCANSPGGEDSTYGIPLKVVEVSNK